MSLEYECMNRYFQVPSPARGKTSSNIIHRCLSEVVSRVVRDSICRFMRAFDKCGQATKGVWGMSWHQEAMKGVEVCDKPGGVDKQVMIPGFPNQRVANP
jgi:hypothetical protein